MDWKYKHFNQHATFRAPVPAVLEAARAVLAEAFEAITPTSDGFVARGRSAWHVSQATFHASSVAEGTQLNVELLVERAAMRGYMLFDVGGYYNSQIDKWFAGVSHRLGVEGEQSLVAKSTSGHTVHRGCLAGCLVWFAAAASLGLLGTALDRALSPASSGSFAGPFGLAASSISLLAGIAVFLHVTYPDNSISQFVDGLLRSAGIGRRD
jgi:hypothetical protein